ncbi:MAG: hypothetical protein HRU03_01690 [Nanoarchaeales archaeon]|nr:hypothetical protein [Nanoarchaeales archaeon]
MLVDFIICKKTRIKFNLNSRGDIIFFNGEQSKTSTRFNKSNKISHKFILNQYIGDTPNISKLGLETLKKLLENKPSSKIYKLFDFVIDKEYPICA